MRLRIKPARPKNRNDAVLHAVELEAINRAERKHLESEVYMRSAFSKDSEEKNCLEKDLRTLQKKLFPAFINHSRAGSSRSLMKQKNTLGKIKKYQADRGLKDVDAIFVVQINVLTSDALRTRIIGRKSHLLLMSKMEVIKPAKQPLLVLYSMQNVG